MSKAGELARMNCAETMILVKCGGATLCLTNREQFGEASFYIALSRHPGERDLVGQRSCRMGLILPSDCSPTPPCPSRPSRPPPPCLSRATRTPKEVYKTTTVSRRSARTKTNGQTIALARENGEHITASYTRPPQREKTSLLPTPVPDLRNAAVIVAGRRQSGIARSRWIKPKQPRRRHSPLWRHIPPLRPSRTLHHSSKSVSELRCRHLCHHSHKVHVCPEHRTGKGKSGRYGAVRGNMGQDGAIRGSKGQKGKVRDRTTEKKRACFPDEDVEKRPKCEKGTHDPTALQVMHGNRSNRRYGIHETITCACEALKVMLHMHFVNGKGGGRGAGGGRWGP